MSKQVRIRYQYNNKGNLVSSRPILINDGLVDVVLYEQTLSFALLKVGTNNVVFTSDNFPSLQALKKAVKTKVIELGATFDAEFRLREPHNLLDEISDLNWKDTEEEQTA